MMNDMLKDILADIGEVSCYLWQKGWAERNAGNVSIDVTEDVPKVEGAFKRFSDKSVSSFPELAGSYFFITATGSRFRDVSRSPEENVLLVRITRELDGYELLWGGKRPGIKPTSEFISHLKIHAMLRRKNLPQRVFLHTHPTHLIALSNIGQYTDENALNQLLWSMHPEVRVFLPEGVGFAPYRCPGSEDLADVTINALESHRVVLWEKHGAGAIGSDIKEAFDLLDMTNKAAEIFTICKSAGFQPRGLSDEQLDELAKL